jgi:hypothetical protein
MRSSLSIIVFLVLCCHIELAQSVRSADQYPGADASVKTNACIADVVASGGGTCDLRNLAGDQLNLSERLNIGADNMGDNEWVTVILPAYGKWSWSSITDGTSCLVTQYSHSSMLGSNTGQGIQFQFVAAPGSNVASVYCTQDAPAVDRSYLRAEGFMARANVGAAVTRAVAEFRRTFDNSLFRSISVITEVPGSKAIWVWGTCCGTSFYNISANARSVGIPFTLGNPGVMVTMQTNFFGLAPEYPGAGYSNVVIEENSTWTTNNNIFGLYMEGPLGTNDTTTPAILIRHTGDVSAAANSIYGAQLRNDVPGSTRPLIEIDPGAKLNATELGNSNSNFIVDHNGGGVTVNGSPNGSLATYTTDPSVISGLKTYSIYPDRRQYVDFSQGGGFALNLNGNVVSNQYPRWVLKSTNTNTGARQSMIDFVDGNNSGWELSNEVNGGNAPFSFYPITGGTRRARAGSVDNTGRWTFNGGVAVNESVARDGSGLKHKRVPGCATLRAPGYSCSTTINWETPFVNSYYTVSCTGDGVLSGVPVSGGVTAKTSTSVTFSTVAATGAVARYTMIDCIAMHD